MKKSILYSLIVMLGLYTLWWLSGGSIVGFRQKPAPIDYLASFVVDNFQTGMAVIFEAVSSLLKI